ncbi:Transcriptional regulator, ArsR family [hydrothermal vent metagenome]|uniref:Transcriptional regulator, ArsR family n=1 Tax=hydrothermal vent metagenome TaxID=652676 RepID=A0A3B1BTY6_9ZZZZ
MTKINIKQALFEQLARVGKAISSSNRLELLDFLAQGEKSVERLAEVSGLTVPNTSQHLQNLKRSGLVTARRDGQRVLYSLSDGSVVELLGVLRKIAEGNLAEVDQIINLYLKAKDDLEPVPAEELVKRIERGLVTVLDVRPEDEYASGHVPGAINIPLKELEERLEELSAGKEVIAYCRGPYCVLSFDAVARLRELGFKARRLEDGFPEWEHAKLPVEK